MKNTTLKELISESISGTWGEEGGETFVIRAANFTNTGTIDFSNIAKRVIEENVIEEKQLKGGDIIIEKSGGGPNTPVGRVVQFIKNDSEIYLANNFTAVLRPNKKIVYPDYFFYQLFYLYQTGVVKKYQNQTTGIYNLKLERYLKESIVLPEISTQVKTSALLNNIQILINKRKESILLCDKYIKSQFYERFGDPILDDKKIGKKKLRYFGDWNSGGTPPKKLEKHFNGDIPWFTSGELNDVFISESKEKINLTAIDESSAKLVKKGSILIGMYDTAALKTSITTVECSCNQAIAFSKLNEELCEPVFIYFNILLGREYFFTKRKGARQKNFSLSMIKELEILNPEKKHQSEFVRIFQIVSKIKESMLGSLNSLERLLETSLYNAFANKLEIDDKKYFENIVEQIDVVDLKKEKRLDYLVDLFNKNKKQFSNLTKYQNSYNKLLELLEDGSIEQIYQSGKIKLKIKK